MSLRPTASLRLAALLAALSALPPRAAWSQACQVATPGEHAASVDYRVGPALGSGAPVQAEAGFTYLRRVAGGALAGASNAIILGGGWHNGRVSGLAGPDVLTWHATGHATVVARLFSVLSVCAQLGAGYQRAGAGPVARSHLEVPLGVGLGLSIPLGGLTVLPWAMPTAAYFVRVPTDDLSAAAPWLRRSGRDLALSAGVGLRFGRLEAHGAWRLRDERLLGQPQFRMHALVWF